MREIIAGWLLIAAFFPQSTGYVVHKIWNDLKVGWQQVQDK